MQPTVLRDDCGDDVAELKRAPVPVGIGQAARLAQNVDVMLQHGHIDESTIWQR